VDDSLFILEYESDALLKDFLKYTKYIVHAVERLTAEGIGVNKVILAVIYTGDVKEAPDRLDVGALKVQAEQVFLSKFDTEALYAGLKQKIEANEPLNDDDVMRFIILPLTQPKKERKQKLIEDTVDLAKRITDEHQQLFIIAGLLTATDKFIDRDYSNSIKGWIRMTKVARLFEEEKIEAVNAKTCQVAVSLLQDGIDIPRVMKYTGLTREQIEQAWKDANNIAV
jgi:hypothetical protein